MLKAHSLKESRHAALDLYHCLAILAQKKKKDTSGNLVFYLDHYLKSGKKFKYKRWLNVTINLTFHNLKRTQKSKQKAAC